MALYYDNEVFEKYHALAISNPSQFVEGKTYYSNSYPEKFTFRGLQTNAEHYDSVGLVWKHAGGDEVEWVIAEYELFNNQPTTDSLSLSDRNIGAHYNPWLIFEDEAVMNACKEELEVTYEQEDDWLDSIEYELADDYLYEGEYDEISPYEMED